MSNVNNPRGFYPLRHLCGGTITTNKYVLKPGQTVFQGDLVTALSTGDIQASAAGDGTAVVGVAAEYKVAPASGVTYVSVWDDPYIVFGVQASLHTNPVTQADVFATANHVAGTGNPTTGLSGHQLNTANIGTGSQLKILGRVETPDNVFGAHYVDLAVLINQHKYKAAVAGV